MTRNIPPLALCAALLLAAACDGWWHRETSDAPPVGSVVAIAPHWPETLTEASGAAVSRRQPGIWFTINDSGNAPELYAIDTTGAGRGVWRVDGARNVDWESLALGPCGDAPAAGACLYVGDTGDNDERRPTRSIYRVPEPGRLAPGGRGAMAAVRLVYRYADRPHDVEAMYVAPNRDVILITKRRLRDAGGRDRPALVFRVPAAAWGGRDTAVAALVDSLPIVPASTPGRLVTDAALSPGGRRLVVRTYAEVYLFATDSVTGRIDHRAPPVVCSVIGLNETTGEAVSWLDERRLLLASEGATEPAHVATCPGSAR